MCWNLITTRIHNGFAIRVMRTVANFVVLPSALLLVLYGVHVVKHDGAVLTCLTVTILADLITHEWSKKCQRILSKVLFINISD